jgi:large subunit ribosomal protein L31
MKLGIHPELQAAQVTCVSCGASFETRSSAGDVRIEVCSSCHPAYTGQSARVSSSSRVERFERRLERSLRR